MDSRCTEELGGKTNHENSSDISSSSISSDQNDIVATDLPNPPLPPVQPQTIERLVDIPSASGTNRSGALRAPNELGRQETEDEASNRNPIAFAKFKTAGIHPRSAAARRRSMAAIKSSMTQAAVAGSAEAVTTVKKEPEAHTGEPAMICSLTYRGMDVIFATAYQPEARIYGICARTRFVFQTLELPGSLNSDDNGRESRKITIISVAANQFTGLVAVAISDGTIRTFSPVASDPATHAFGRYRWVKGVTIRCSQIFYQHAETPLFVSRRIAKPGEAVELSSSRDWKLLVTHRNQMAVFDVSPAHERSSETTIEKDKALKGEGEIPIVAQLLWISSTKQQIVMASMSGDGLAMAVVTDDAKAGVYDTTCGVHIYLRDHEDGSQINQHDESGAQRQNTSPVGILYKQGPFLEHSEPVTRISFRGLGHKTASDLTNDEQGNDLLLTYSKHDCMARIFCQGTWSKLVEWATPERSRVDWIRGSAAFSLGDLETQKRMVPRSESKPPSRSPSSQNLVEEDVGSPGMLQGGKQLLHNTSPSSTAGAWIVEMTFSGLFPGLRLSRLSFLKRGSETMHPALFESVASILPGASLLPEAVLDSSEESLCFHGIWPAWNPWLSETAELHSEATLSGSAMSFLGLSSGSPGATAGHFGESILGGPHSPPSELRLVASHSLCGNVVLMEFPLWGNRDLGELELGNALRHVLAVPDIAKHYSSNSEIGDNKRGDLVASTDYESSKLVAKFRKESMSITLAWRSQGTMSIYPASWKPMNYVSCVTEAKQPMHSAGSMIHDEYCDSSLLPVPLALPQLFLPRRLFSSHNETVQAIEWWPDDNFGGPPMLVVVSSAGSIFVFEVPPLWSALEPPMPTNDSYFESTGSTREAELTESVQDFSGAGTDDESDNASEQKEYDVMITPHPDFGLGLRLESQLDGMPAVAGSYKKHPLTGGSLPAEKAGMIVLGDELLSVNGVKLEGMSFDDIIATVRQTGATAGPGKPLCMRFRRVHSNVRHGSFERLASVPVETPASEGARRSMERIFGMTTASQKLGSSSRWSSPSHRPSGSRGSLGLDSFSRSNSEAGSNATILVGADSEVQQEFCRLVGVASKAIPCAEKTLMAHFRLLPWSSLKDSSTPEELRGSAMLVSSSGSQVIVTRIEVSSDCNPDKANAYCLGTCDIREDANENLGEVSIECLSIVDGNGNWPRLVICDSMGTVRLLFLSVGATNSELKEGDSRHPLTVSFRPYKVFRLDRFTPAKCIIRAMSVDIIATVHYKEPYAPVVTVWSSRPHPSGVRRVGTEVGEYAASELPLVASENIVDICFLQSGYLDSYPLLVTVTPTEAVVYQKFAERISWEPMYSLSYDPNLDSVKDLERLSWKEDPTISLPHLIPALRALSRSYEEMRYLRADWHPDSFLARVSTDVNGAKSALRHHIRGYFFWLAKEGRDEASSAECNKPLYACSPLSAVCYRPPCGKVYGSDNDAVAATGDEGVLLRRLRSALFAGKPYFDGDSDGQKDTKSGALFTGTEAAVEDLHLPSALRSFSSDELRLLWAIGEVALEPPDFKNIDKNGEFFVFASSLFKKIKLLPDEEAYNAIANYREIHSFNVKKKPVKPVEDVGSCACIASGACLFALLSNSQNALLESCRCPGATLDWESVKENNIPLWIRSDRRLAKLAEEVGQNMFREKRDILECALFFILARKHRTLRNLAATDQSDSGGKFRSFLTRHDFTSERGRRAAEKNAYSLLRKRRYTVAAAFFLLAEPPFLKSAIEVIATKLQDLNLAFLVARLMESDELSSTQQNSQISPGMLGVGGSGFASSIDSSFSLESEEGRFDTWRPSLSNGARRLLLVRGLPSSSDDNCLTAILLLWLDLRQEACYWLSGLHRTRDGSPVLPDVGDALPSLVLARPADCAPTVPLIAGTRRHSRMRICARINGLLNFFCGPLLLKRMKADARSKFASALITSSALIRCGIDLSPVHELLKRRDSIDNDSTEKDANSDEHDIQKKHENSPESNVTTQDDYSAASEEKTMASTNGKMESDIFDSFNAAPQQKVSSSGGHKKPSMFDGIGSETTEKDATNSASGSVATGQTESSIFDRFDVAPRQQSTPAPAPMPSHGQMESSIFDSFDAAPVRVPAPTPAPSADMTSSIFDSFDVPLTTVVPKAAASSTSPAFDVLPEQKKPNGRPEVAINSSTFGTYDATTARQEESEQHKFLSEAKDSYDEFEEIHVEPMAPSDTPKLWWELRDNLLLLLAARRLIRELARLLSESYGDACDPPLVGVPQPMDSLLPPRAAQVLQLPCESEEILRNIRDLVGKLSKDYEMPAAPFVQLSLRLLAVPQCYNRLFFAVLLNLSNERGDLAEDLVRGAAKLMIQRCDAFAIANDEPSAHGQTRFQMSSQYTRRDAVRLSWQLELCLWLHRGGALPLSSAVLNEAIVAVRIGFILCSWNGNYKCLENLIRSEPDCLMDTEAARQLWTSLKIVSGKPGLEKAVGGVGSGGWEFLVDCRRSEATELLRLKPTGCFIIRPHPEDHGVFTLSFKTNLVPTDSDDKGGLDDQGQQGDPNRKPPRPKTSRPVKKDDVVQHAILRLSDSGFRCGSFGPFATLMKLLEAVSASLPFDLRFDQPPAERVIKDEGSQPSPNAVFLRKLVLRHAESLLSNPTEQNGIDESTPSNMPVMKAEDNITDQTKQKLFGLFLELLVLSAIRKSLSAVVAAKYENQPMLADHDCVATNSAVTTTKEGDSEDESIKSDSRGLKGIDKCYASSSRMLRPFLNWCRILESISECELAPAITGILHTMVSSQITLSASETAIEAVEEEVGRGDFVIRRMIKPNSGVAFRTLRLGDGGDSTVVVLFSKREAIEWLMKFGSDKSKEAALAKLEAMEKIRVIEPIDLSRLQLKAYTAQKTHETDDGEEGGVRYRIIDPWEVEALESREGETRSASIGREKFLAFSLGKVAKACEETLRRLGGFPVLELWTSAKGGVVLTKALASVHAPWERGPGGDIHTVDGHTREPTPFSNSIRQHLYRNSLFRRVRLPQRFLSLLQVELLDLKNLTAPGGSLSLTAYALLRLRRSDSGAPLTSKNRTLDSAATQPVKLAKSSGPNAPASWGSVIRFRFPLPEDVSCDGVSLDRNREILFKVRILV